jgi:hypothetical protein
VFHVDKFDVQSPEDFASGARWKQIAGINDFQSLTTFEISNMGQNSHVLDAQNVCGAH